jgi:glucose/arabinose dehydrogenase
MRSNVHLAVAALLAVAVAGCEDLSGVDDDDLDTGVALELVADGLTSPVTMAEAPDGSGRLFVVDQIGLIRIIEPDGTLRANPFLDVTDLIEPLMPGYDERGLLGLAFHPDFATNGRFFVYYAAPPRLPGYDNTSTVAEYHAAPGSSTAQPVGIILQEDQPQFNHEAGTLAFGPDGYLYVSIGDGGGRDDEGNGPATDTPRFGHVDDWYPTNPGGNGQDLQANLLGNVLRLDVSTPGSYTIPPDNPFVDEGQGEVYAYGFRNPYRFSFDMGGNHDLYLGDAGQDMWEEIDVVVKGGNYGWNVKEGTHCFDAQQPTTTPGSCPSTDPTTGEPLRDPVIEMPNYANPNKGNAVAPLVILGGYVYRGDALPQFRGQYIFGAFTTEELDEGPAGVIFTALPSGSAGLWPTKSLEIQGLEDGELDHFILGFGQDLDGEVYVLTTDNAGPTGNTGKVFRLAPEVP